MRAEFHKENGRFEDIRDRAGAVLQAWHTSGAGVTKPSLYRAYKSKDDLVAACLEESSREGRAALDAAIIAAGPCPRDRLKAVAQHFADKIRCPEFRGCLVSNVAVELPEPGHPGRVIVESCKTELRAVIGQLTRALDIAEPDELAHAKQLAGEFVTLA